MGYASYSENIAEKFNERLSVLLKVASQVKRGPAGSKDLSISHQQKLQQLLTDLAGLLSTLLQSLDDPAVAARLSTKSLGEALSQALSQSAHLEATNRELHRQLEAGKKQATVSAQTLTKTREEIARLEASNAKLRKAGLQQNLWVAFGSGS